MISKHEFAIGQNGTMTSLVMDESEFHELVDKLAKLIPPADQGEKIVAEVKKNGIIPLVYKEPITEPLFAEYDIKSPQFSAIIRGRGGEVLDKALKQDTLIYQDPDKEGVTNVRQDFAIAYQTVIYDLLPKEVQTNISVAAENLWGLMKENKPIYDTVFWWHKRNAEGVAKSFWEKLSDAAIASIQTTQESYVANGLKVSDPIFGDYLRRLLANDYFVFDCHRSLGLPAYIRTKEAEARMTPILALVKVSFSEWAESIKKTIPNKAGSSGNNPPKEYVN